VAALPWPIGFPFPYRSFVQPLFFHISRFPGGRKGESRILPAKRAVSVAMASGFEGSIPRPQVPRRGGGNGCFPPDPRTCPWAGRVLCGGGVEQDAVDASSHVGKAFAAEKFPLPPALPFGCDISPTGGLWPFGARGQPSHACRLTVRRCPRRASVPEPGAH